MRAILISIIKGYQRYLSPFFPNTCRFSPTCSSYARDAIEKHGSLKGAWLVAYRLSKCHPWHAGGIDLVPEPKKTK